ncbi:hypothetical protein ACHAXR_007323 [Thalassiosira sp. AJA248-18]
MSVAPAMAHHRAASASAAASPASVDFHGNNYNNNNENNNNNHQESDNDDDDDDDTYNNSFTRLPSIGDPFSNNNNSATDNSIDWGKSSVSSAMYHSEGPLTESECTLPTTQHDGNFSSATIPSLVNSSSGGGGGGGDSGGLSPGGSGVTVDGSIILEEEEDGDNGAAANEEGGCAFGDSEIERKLGEVNEKMDSCGGVDSSNNNGKAFSIDDSNRTSSSTSSRRHQSRKKKKKKKTTAAAIPVHHHHHRPVQSVQSERQITKKDKEDDKREGAKKSKSYAFRRSSSGWNEMIETKINAKKKQREDAEHGAVAVPTSVIVSSAEDAVQTWKESSGPLHDDYYDHNGEDDNEIIHPNIHPLMVGQEQLLDETTTPQEEDELAEKEKMRRKLCLGLCLCLVLLGILILGIVLGVSGSSGNGDDDTNNSDIVESSTNLRGDSPSTQSPSPSMKPTRPPLWFEGVDTIAVPAQGAPSPAPVTPPPTTIVMEETVHPVDLILDNVADGYILPTPVRNSIVSFVEDMVKGYLEDSPVELVDVAFDDSSENDENNRKLRSTSSSSSSLAVLQIGITRRRLAAIPLPLLITVNGPADISGLHLLYIMEALQDTSDLGSYLKTLNPVAFGDVAISIESESFELDGVVEAETAEPTPSPVVSTSNLFGPVNAPVTVAPITPKPINNDDAPVTTATPTSRPSKPPSPPPTTPKPTSKSPTKSPITTESVDVVNCPADVQPCSDGSYVSRNPFQFCNFYPCPTPQPLQQTPPPTKSPTPMPVSVSLVVVNTNSPTITPTLITDSPTPKPVSTESPTRRPTPPPTPPPTVSPPGTTESPTTESPTTDNPSLQPTTSVSLMCSPNPPPNPQCGAEQLLLLEKCASSDTLANDQYGNALSITTRWNNDVYAIVGARFHAISGSAYLISYDGGTNQWEHVAEFVPGGASANGGFDGDVSSSYDQFGYDVTISDDWVAISAPFDTASTGKVSLFWLDGVSKGGQLEPSAELVPTDITYGARFGSSLAMEGDMLVVGASKDRGNVGSAYIYKYSNSAGNWVQMAKLEPDDASADSQGNFGHSVAISQGIVAVGAPMDGTSGRRRNGSVYIYSEVGISGSYALLQKIVPSELLGGDQFGFSLAVERAPHPSTNVQETRVAIGAKLRDDKGIDSGSVYMYRRVDGENDFSYEQKLTPFQWSAGAEMGTSIDMHQHKIIVGAKKQDGIGGAYYFQYDGGTWVDMEAVTPLNVGGNDGDDFGSAVALTSGVALVGSYSNDEVGVDGGTMYSYAVCN